MKAMCQRRISEIEEFDLDSIAKVMIEEVESGFVRKEFVDFDYLKVRPPLWAILVFAVVILATSVGVTYLFVNNNIKEQKRRKRW